jgi:prepilin-type N-terminal cleavage/methylation domain-containing protein
MKATLAAKRRANGQSGFTLIELLVVIAILAVLSGVVVFAVSGISNDSQDSACKAEKRTVDTAIEAYRAENGSYPTTIGQLTPGFLKDTPTLYGMTGTPPQASTLDSTVCP